MCDTFVCLFFYTFCMYHVAENISYIFPNRNVAMFTRSCGRIVRHFANSVAALRLSHSFTCRSEISFSEMHSPTMYPPEQESCSTCLTRKCSSSKKCRLSSSLCCFTWRWRDCTHYHSLRLSLRSRSNAVLSCSMFCLFVVLFSLFFFCPVELQHNDTGQHAIPLFFVVQTAIHRDGTMENKKFIKQLCIWKTINPMTFQAVMLQIWNVVPIGACNLLIIFSCIYTI